MGSLKEKEVKDKFVPQQEDIDRLRENIKPFEQKRFGPYLISRFEQYCASIGVTRIAEDGNIIVRDAQGYKQLNDINEKMSRQDYAHQEQVFEAFPEKRDEAVARLKANSPLKKMPI